MRMPTRSELRTARRILEGLGFLRVDPLRAWKECDWLRRKVGLTPSSVTVPVCASGVESKRGRGGLRGGVAFDGEGRPAGMVLEPSVAMPNRLVVVTCGDPSDTVATVDPADRAHPQTNLADGGRDWGPRHVPAADVPTAKPRRYPPSHMTSAGVVFDSMFDETHERLCRLRALVGDIEGLTSMRTAEESVAMQASRMRDELRLRDIVDRSKVNVVTPARDAAGLWLSDRVVPVTVDCDGYGVYEDQS